MKLELNNQQHERALSVAFRESAEVLSGEITKQITENKWNWPNPPSPRDIVDKGRLRAAQQLEIIALFAVMFSWPVEYAAAVFLGATLRNGTTLPARNAPLAALAVFNDRDVFGKLARRELARVR